MEDLECSICLQPCVHPVQLPCRHIFCFLCIKGVLLQSSKCALCRQKIDAEYLHNPHLVHKPETHGPLHLTSSSSSLTPPQPSPSSPSSSLSLSQPQPPPPPSTLPSSQPAPPPPPSSSSPLPLPSSVNVTDHRESRTAAGAPPYQWYYSGRAGWWRYEQRVCAELHELYDAGLAECELLIGGFLYLISFTHMTQARKNAPHLRRYVLRARPDTVKNCLGEAGIRKTLFTGAESSGARQGDGGGAVMEQWREQMRKMSRDGERGGNDEEEDEEEEEDDEDDRDTEVTTGDTSDLVAAMENTNLQNSNNDP